MLKLIDLFTVKKPKITRKKTEEFIDGISILRVPKLRRMSLRVKPTGEVAVRAPVRVSLPTIRRFVSEHAAWIAKQRQNHASLVPLSQQALARLRDEAKNILP